MLGSPVSIWITSILRVKRLVIIAAVVVTGGLTAGAEAAVDYSFHTPSTNISCMYSSFAPATLRCDIASLIVPPQPRSAQCTPSIGVWNQGYSMGPTGGARQVCASDTVVDPRGHVLAYGTTWRGGGFSCSSQTTGLRCTNRSGHGFFESRQRSYAF